MEEIVRDSASSDACSRALRRHSVRTTLEAMKTVCRCSQPPGGMSAGSVCARAAKSTSTACATSSAIAASPFTIRRATLHTSGKCRAIN